MLNIVSAKSDNLTSCYLMGGDFLDYFDKYFESLDEIVDCYCEQPGAVMMCTLNWIDSKYDEAVLNLYQKFVDDSEFLVSIEEFPKYSRSNLTMFFVDELIKGRIACCKIVS